MYLIVLVFLFSVRLARTEYVCCELIGCFDDMEPFNKMPLPECLESMRKIPMHHVFTRKNLLTPQILTQDNIPEIFDFNKDTVLVVHGWNSDSQSKWVPELKDALLNREDTNVIVLDWKYGANNVIYPQSASNTRSVGAYSALVMKSLIEKHNYSKDKIWCMGHSLGAHVCGHLGMKTKIQRITGMDPAGPEFESVVDIKVGINPTSAEFVDIIHTDNIYGTTRPLGHVDFYPNGGKQQPGCISNTCSHLEVTKFMIESVKNDCFKAYKSCTDFNKLPKSCNFCNSGFSCAIMGYASTTSPIKNGILYLETDKKPPYCQNLL